MANNNNYNGKKIDIPAVEGLNPIGAMYSISSLNIKKFVTHMMSMNDIKIDAVIVLHENNKIRVIIGIPSDSPDVDGNNGDDNIAPHIKNRIRNSSVTFSSRLYKALIALSGSNLVYNRNKGGVVIEIDVFRVIALMTDADKGNVYITSVKNSGKKDIGSILYVSVITSHGGNNNNIRNDVESKYYNMARNL